MLCAAGLAAHAQSLVHYWNFNNSESLESLLAPTGSLTGDASFFQVEGSAGEIQITSNTGQNFDTENLNARNGDPAGSHLRFNNPIGGVLQVNLPTVGFKDAVVKYVTRRSGSGAGAQLVSYTTDGANYAFFETITVSETPTLITLDFSNTAGVSNNANFGIRIEFEAAGGGTVGNNRFDNFTLDANLLPSLALMHYWNFNNSESLESLLSPSYTEVGGSSIVQIPGGISAIQITSNTGQNFDVENLNARFGDPAATHLRFNDPIGGGLLWNLPTSGHEGIAVKYATRRSGSGAGIQLVSYTTDGVNFTDFTSVTVTETPTLITFDFSAVEGASNNPLFAVRLLFQAGSGGTVGNNRFDNLTCEGFPMGGSDTAPPVATLSPLNNSINLPVNTIPTASFNEPVTLADGTPLTPENIATAVELRLNDATGELVAFDATYADNVITINPLGGLLNSQTYYLAVLGGTIADLNGNVQPNTVSVVFSTIALQTAFNPGDIAIIAYRMNTTDINDQFAFLTFVDIMPGTLINMADAKYTSNAQPQCPGGLVWTAPATGVAANSVVVVNNDGGTTSAGTISGSTFGLSSGGDQIIMYTGTAANPAYITALSSNAWVETATNCGGSLSQLPGGLQDGVSSINLSTSPNAVSGNLVNGYYNGPQDLPAAQLRAAILNPANWVGTGAGTPAQPWPVWAFGDVPAVVSAQVLLQNSIEVLFNRALDQSSAEDLNNYTGMDGIASAVLSEVDGVARRVVLSYAQPFVAGVQQSLTVSNVQSTSGTPMAAPFTFTFTFNPTVAWANGFKSVSEDAGSVTIQLNFSNPAVSSFDLVVKGAPWSTADAGDFTYAGETIQFDGITNSIQITFPVIDDNEGEQDEYLAIYIENESGVAVSGRRFITVYIRDNDRVAPVANKRIELLYVTSFNPDLDGSSSVEVISYDPGTQRIFATSAVENRLDAIDFSNPAAPVTVATVNMAQYGGGITSVAVKNGIVAAAVPNANEQLNGSVVFFDADLNFISQVNVGALPDMITFNHDGSKVLTANEGQPNSAYTIDPEGSVSVISLANGVASLTQNAVTTLLFTQFNADEAALIASGVRKTFAASTLSQDLEPEYISVTDDGSVAYIVCQENNAIVTLDLNTLEYTNLQALGTKDYMTLGNGFDASDNSGVIHISNWPMKGYYIPDAIANYEVNGVRYIVTANEGDEKEYGGLNERTTVDNNNTVLDPTIFPHADFLKAPWNLGRMRISNLQGDTDGDGDYDEIYGVGSRSFSIFNAETMELVYDSQDDMEQITAADPIFGALFNASNDNNNFKNRSRAKGPEPEGLALANIKGRTYAFITLERTGGCMVYDITDPGNVAYVDYKNTRTPSGLGGDLGPEVVIYIDPTLSPDGKGYVLMSNEISGTITVFEVLGAEPDRCKYYLSNYNSAGGSDIYEVELNEETATAEMSQIISVPQRVSLAFDETSSLLYFVRENGSFQSYNPANGILGLPVSVNVGLSGLTGAAFDGNGIAYAASANAQAIFKFNPGNFTGSLFSAAQVNGGDIDFDANGNLILVSRNPNRAFVVNENAPNTILSPVPATVSGLAKRANGNFLVLSQGSNQLIEGNTVQGDLGIRYTLQLNGAPFTPANGDLASGCAVQPSAAFAGLAPVSDTREGTEVRAVIHAQPNPTEGDAFVTFEAQYPTRAIVEAYDVSGRLVATLYSGDIAANQPYTVNFNGRHLPNGVYVYRLTTQSEVVTERFLIAR